MSASGEYRAGTLGPTYWASGRRRRLVPGYRPQRHRHHSARLRQRRDPDRRSGRSVVAHRLDVDLVERREVGDVEQEDRHLDDVAEVRPRRLEHHGEVREDLTGLAADVRTRELATRGIDPCQPANRDPLADLRDMAVRPEWDRAVWWARCVHPGHLDGR